VRRGGIIGLSGYLTVCYDFKSREVFVFSDLTRIGDLC